ncbi:MAG: hypothetical protein MHM6MM_009542, partial [Cercozoa sp. M6MM]
MPVNNYTQALFAPTLQFAAKDSLFGGMMKRQIGMGSLDLEPFVRMLHDPEAREAFRQGVKVPVIDAVAEQQERDERRTKKLRQQRELEAQRRRDEERAREDLLFEILDGLEVPHEPVETGLAKELSVRTDHELLTPVEATQVEMHDMTQHDLRDHENADESKAAAAEAREDVENEFSQKIFVFDAAAASEHAGFGDNKEDLASDKPFYMV